MGWGRVPQRVDGRLPAGYSPHLQRKQSMRPGVVLLLALTRRPSRPDYFMECHEEDTI